ncbi:MAG TPA: DUF433 domain-containing protein [Chloroflexota bacterium]|jgi:uncharacterized protein (DUF433 family)
MQQIRRAFSELEEVGLSRDQLGSIVAESRDGKLFLRLGDVDAQAARGRQAAIPDMIELVQPYNSAPHLLTPRPLLRILPGKLHGEPHILHTRIPTAAIYELERLGYSLENIHKMYPAASRAALEEAIEFERSLERKPAA